MDKNAEEITLLNRYDELDNNINELKAQAIKCKQEQNSLFENFKNTYAKFKIGDIVCFKKHKKKSRNVVANVHCYRRQGHYDYDKKDYTHYLQISYTLKTINGYDVNGGWSVEEDELEPYSIVVTNIYDISK